MKARCTRSGRLTAVHDWLLEALVRVLPQVLITDTWQIILAVAMFGAGVSTIYAMAVGQSGAIANTLPSLVLRGAWSLSFLAGGALQVYGVHRSRRRPERLGMHLCGLGCTTLGLTLLALRTPPSFVYAVVYLVLATGYFTRIFISSAARVQRGP